MRHIDAMERPKVQSEPAIGRYYDRLARYGAAMRWLGFGGGYGDASVHRALTPERADERPTGVVHRLIGAELDDVSGKRVLDAGCGLGGTSFYFAQQHAAFCEGIGLSQAQIARATRMAAKMGLAAHCEFRVASYDDLPALRRYDAAVAIESLAHSPDLAASIARLAQTLVPGGRLVVVDDVAEPGADANDAATFRAGWAVPSFVGRSAWLDAFAQAGLRVVVEHDLSARIVRRAAWPRETLVWLNRAAAAAVPVAGVRAVLASHFGGLALERLYAKGGASYRLFVAL